MVRGSKFILSILILSVITANICFADTSADLSSGIESYKNGNYNECIVKLNNLVKSDPTQVLGYYYLALSYSKLNKQDIAEQNYNKVINLGSDKVLADYARQAKSIINSKKVVIESTDETKNIESEDDYNPILNDGVMTEGNSQKNPEEKKLTKETVPNKTYEKITNKKLEYNPNREPTNDEIVNAIKILQKAGILSKDAAAVTGNNHPYPQQQNQYPQQYPQQNPYMDSRTQQMNSMLMMMNSGNNNNGMMNMMPYMQNGGKIDPQLMQMMLMQQMMPNFSNTNNNNNY